MFFLPETPKVPRKVSAPLPPGTFSRSSDDESDAPLADPDPTITKRRRLYNAFVASQNAGDEVFHARLVTALGARAAGTLLKSALVRLQIAPELDLDGFTNVVGDQLKAVGAAPVFSGLSAPLVDSALTAVLMAASIVILFDSIRRWTRGRRAPVESTGPSVVTT